METDDEKLRAQLRVALAGEPLVFAYLFGSVARGDATEDSDIDVAVQFDPRLAADERLEARLRLGVALEQAVQRRVDVVDLADAPLRLAGRILTEREVLVGLEQPERVRYEVALLPQYRDVEHHARHLDRQLLARMSEGRA